MIIAGVIVAAVIGVVFLLGNASLNRPPSSWSDSPLRQRREHYWKYYERRIKFSNLELDRLAEAKKVKDILDEIDIEKGKRGINPSA
jgi:hypothetical protein